MCTAAVTLGMVTIPSAAAAVTAADSVYHEPYRPQFHYTPQKNWMNDPNGPIFYKGQYHLFYQYNPEGNQWGNMSWGHAVSKDLVSWKEMPLAISFDDQEAIFSGSVVNDKNNSSGLGTRKNPPLVAIYTSAKPGSQAQSLAYSTDGGTTWTKYEGNPVLDIGSAEFRDPKVFWHEDTKRWVMVVVRALEHKVAIYSSTDLLTWTEQSQFGPTGATGGAWECPALIPLPVDGKRKNQKWVMIVALNPGGVAGGSGQQYFVGDFDGKTFTPDDDGSYTPPAGLDLAGFDEGTYSPWTTTGTAFGDAPAPAAEPLPGQSAITGVEGAGYVNSFHEGDGATGTLTSPTFPVTDRYLNFKVGGGNHPHVEGSVVNPPIPDGTVFADFEGTTWGDGWIGTGDFAAAGPVPGTIGDQQAVNGFVGQRLVNTFIDHDSSTGTITSPTFTIGSSYIDLLIGGGNHPYTGPNPEAGSEPTAVNLVVDGQVVKSATGADNETLDWSSWDLSALQGKQAQIQIIDQNTGGWGHINLDHIVFADQPAAKQNIETAVNLLVNNAVVKTVTGPNSESLDWASFDLADYAGQNAQIQVVDNNTAGWGHILADQFSFAAEPALSTIQRAHWMDWGSDFYAATTVNDAPGGKQIAIGWMSNWNYAGKTPTSPWRGAMAVPRELGLKTIDGKVQLTQQPVRALDRLRTGWPVIGAVKRITGTTPVVAAGATLDLRATFKAGPAEQFGINVRAGNGQLTQIGYDTTTNEVYIDRTRSGKIIDPTFGAVHRAPLPLNHGTVRLRVLVDDSSVEVFTDQGQVVLTDQIFPDATSTGVSLFANGGTATLISGTGWNMKSIWP
jgi:levanase